MKRRLIDANKLKYTRITEDYIGMGRYRVDDDYISKYDIEAAPTVEAVPVKWMEKKMSEYCIKGRYSSDAMPIVYSLISDWRKENEK